MSQTLWPNTTPKNIIVRMPNWLGDLVMATPVLADLRMRYPNAKITAMCQSNVAALLKNNPNINEIYSFRRPSGWIHRRQHLDIIDYLRHGEYDLGILLTNSFSSAWWFWRGNVHNRLGYKGNLRNVLLNKAWDFPKEKNTQHLVITYKMLLEPLGIPVSETAPQLFIAPDEQNEAEDLLKNFGFSKEHNKLIGINPGAAYGSAKCWLPDRFRAVAEKLLKEEANYIVFFGDPNGASLVNNICQHLPDRVINLAGKTNLRELLALIQKCDVLLTNDSGPMHIAAALNTPLVALFGSTSDVQTGPYTSQAKVIHKRVACSPCYQRECPIDFKCMKQIGVEEVYQSIHSFLLNPKKKAS